MEKYKGCLKSFPEEIVNRMLDYQEEQGNKRDVSVFEQSVTADYQSGGFDWERTQEKGDFWWNVTHARFTEYFAKYQKKSEYPKVMEVSHGQKVPEYTMDDLFAKLGEKFIIKK